MPNYTDSEPQEKQPPNIEITTGEESEKKQQDKISDLLKPILAASCKYSSFFDLIASEKDVIYMQLLDLQSARYFARNCPQISTTWMGQRASMDIPDLKSTAPVLAKKSIAFELLSQNFLFQPDYSHYEDFEQILRDSYDNFNYFLQQPNHKYLYSEGRRLPEGIFPRADICKTPDRWGERPPDFQGDPNELGFNGRLNLIKAELNNKKEKPGLDARFIVNLLNMQNGLKHNYPDNEIVEKLLGFSFLQQLIEEHLTGSRKKGPAGKMLNRNAGNATLELISVFRKECLTSSMNRSLQELFNSAES